ncbi:hypothetical protein Salat_1696100 [Sesamum alatum]|uniref:Uncharacterized protein n=1 Tax=Sesamum alatum TaxID=300844 RepID=A0AAE1Y7I7_9LAMI|nr:hypothetical protein Salat_1696100 [Sesamum alatum]
MPSKPTVSDLSNFLFVIEPLFTSHRPISEFFREFLWLALRESESIRVVRCLVGGLEGAYWCLEKRFADSRWENEWLEMLVISYWVQGWVLGIGEVDGLGKVGWLGLVRANDFLWAALWNCSLHA